MYSHIVDDITQKGTTGNYSTRPGEGFIQEAKEAYHQTNGKAAEHQVCPSLPTTRVIIDFEIDGQD